MMPSARPHREAMIHEFSRSADSESSPIVHQTSGRPKEMPLIPLILRNKIVEKSWRLLAAVVVGCGALTGCVTSTGPILSDAKALLGERIQVHAFSPAKDGKRDHSTVIYEWTGSRYVPRPASADFTDFTIHPYEGRDLIIQSQANRSGNRTEYGLA